MAGFSPRPTRPVLPADRLVGTPPPWTTSQAPAPAPTPEPCGMPVLIGYQQPAAECLASANITGAEDAYWPAELGFPCNIVAKFVLVRCVVVPSMGGHMPATHVW